MGDSATSQGVALARASANGPLSLSEAGAATLIGGTPLIGIAGSVRAAGSGEVVVYSRGGKIEGRWTRETPADPFTLDAGGQPILLQPGRTWVEVAAAGS